MQASVTAALWHGSFGTAPGRLVLVEEPGSARPYDLAIFTLDTAASPEAVIERYAWRWPIEPSNAAGKQIMGVGDACNRVTAAVERTVPSGFLVQSLLICWYARYAYDPADVARRRMLCPWYTTKTEPSTADMLARLRREFLTARFPAIRPGRGCRIALHDSVSIPNSRPEHGRMSGSDDQIVGGMCRMPDLTKPLGKLCDSLGQTPPGQIPDYAWTCDTLAA